MLNSIMQLYYILINLLLFLIMGTDKLCAIFHKWRIPEATLLILSLIGGGIGGFLAMFIFHHKIRKRYFMITFILSIAVHLIIYMNI